MLIFINQIREKIGVMFGSPETTPGGRALKFYSSCRIDVRRIGPVKEGEEVVGSRIKVKVVKNKVAPPFRVCEFDMMYSGGISREGDLMDLAMADKLIEKSGSWFNYGDTRLGQGRENAKQYLRDNPEVANEISRRVMASRAPSMAPRRTATPPPPTRTTPPTKIDQRAGWHAHEDVSISGRLAKPHAHEDVSMPPGRGTTLGSPRWAVPLANRPHYDAFQRPAPHFPGGSGDPSPSSSQPRGTLP